MKQAESKPTPVRDVVV